MDRFLIGNILVQIDYAGVPVLSEGNLRRFVYDGDWDGDQVTLSCLREPLEQYLQDVVIRNGLSYDVCRYQGQTGLIYRWGRLFNGFAVWPERFAVSFDPGMYVQPALREDWFFSVCGFHRQLLLRGGCVLHASYVDIGGEAILFTGPSGMGKSTQAGLWERYEGAQVVNGDRAALRRIGETWHTFGYPSCGTSGICLNRTLPLKAVVVLAQGPENRFEPLSMSQKIRSLVSAMEQYPWDAEEFDLALHTAAQIAAQVPVLKLSCTPDVRAVDTLKRYLEGSEGYDAV